MWTGRSGFCRKVIFRAADVKKLAGTPFYRARLTDADRLLFRFACRGKERFLLLLEVIRNHAYGKSRFLNGAALDENKIQETASPGDLENDAAPGLIYANPRLRLFHLLDKVLSFDDAQNEIFSLPPPLILIGSAGSGKTALTIEKLKQLPGDVLYVTLSP